MSDAISLATSIVTMQAASTQQALSMEMIATLEAALGVQANKIMRPMQPGDVTATYADISKLNALTGYRPRVALTEGLPKFVEWWRSFENG